MHFIVEPTLPDQDDTSVELLATQLFPGGGGGEGWTTLSSWKLVRGHTGGITRNRRAYQPPESDRQRPAGDGRPVLGERTMDVLVEGESVLGAQVALTLLEEHLSLATALRYAGLVTPLASVRGITAQQPTSGGKSIRVTVAYSPERQHSEAEDETLVLGVV